MKKLVSLVLALMMLLGMLSFASAEAAETKVAMITDYGDITDQSFNQITYEAAKAYCEANNIPFTYKKPTGDSTAERVAMVEAAIGEGYNVLVMPGYAFGETVAEVQDTYPDVKFIAIDVSAADLGGAEVGKNVVCAIYQEELAGYMAGYAAVKLGYKHLGYLGGMAVPAVQRYGYGFVQGANDAAENKADITVEYVYGNQFYGDADITAYMDNWFQTMGVEVVFACGGGIYTSAAEAAAKVENGKVIGVDVDQAAVINAYKADMALTSAMKGLGATTQSMLDAIVNGKFDEFGGKVLNLGMENAEDPTKNYVQLPETTQWADGFTKDDYMKLVASLANGEIKVSNDITAMPTVEIKVNELGNIK